ncbi:GumC family protein [Parasphingorhabdus sp. DH2-15]|uniref:GumC family protein n=1 Tax=Parasphingorhabdus sp. DH2-15 TaxID=3444112 RepID=UPI003F684473
MKSADSNMVEVVDEPAGFSIDFNELKSMAFRQRYIIIGITILALIFGAIVTLISPSVYQAETKIQIDPDTNDVVEDEVDIRTRLRGADVQRYLNSQLDLLKSRNMARRVVADLRLDANDDFLTKMGAVALDGPTGDGASQTTRLDQITNLLVENVDIELPFGSKVATLSFKSRDRKLAVQIVNTYSKNLITANIDQRFQATTYARDFLQKEIGDAKQRLEEAERRAILYARNTQIIDASDGVSTNEDSTSPRSITTANLVQMNADLAAARTARILAEEKWQSVRNKSALDIADVQQNPTIQQLLSEKAGKEAELRELLNRYKPDHPVALQSRAQITSLDSEVESIASNIRSSIKSEYDIALRQEQSLNRNLNSMKNATLEEQDKRVELNLLAREVETNRSQYQSLLNRYEQVNISSDVVTNNISIIDEAQAAQKVTPRPLINMLLSFLIGAAAAFFVAFLRETFDDSIRTPDDATRKLGLPLLGTTPIYSDDLPIIDTLADRKSAIAEAYASIRSSLEFSTANGAPKSILLASSQPSEGKSTSSVAIAESFARAGKKTLLIDADLRNPSLHQYLNVKNTEGLVGTLTGNADFDKAITQPEAMHFDFLSSGPMPPDPTEIIITNAIARFIKSLEDRYDHIVFDGPPVMGLADSPQMSRAVAGTVLVVEAGRIRGGQTKSAIRRLNDANGNLLGVILSKFDGASSGYGQYYGYEYSYKNSNAR